ncbi:MAG: hypothetical protein V4631_03075 [Pseudomonadota bacterium]
MALLERTGPRGNMGRKFDDDLRAAGSAATTLRGFPALTMHGPRQGRTDIVGSLRFRAPEGVYMLSIIYGAKEVADSAAREKHFFSREMR